MSTLPLGCACGEFRGAVRNVSARRGNRVICYCDDCQAFARHLGADAVLDEHGGTDIFQISQAELDLSASADAIACLRFTPRALRWYTRCCKTPIGNTGAKPSIPFIGLIVRGTLAASAEQIDTVLGPVRYRVQGRYATGNPAGTHPKFPLTMLPRGLALVARARLGRAHHKTPLFDRQGSAVVPPSDA